jgi:hypothetical protein
MMSANLFAQAGMVLYETGFEPPTFVAGQPLAGQDGWSAYADENVQAATATAENALSGTQSAKVDGAVMAPYSERDYYTGFYYRGVPFEPTGSGYSIVEFSVDVFYVPGEGGSDARAQVEMYDSQGGFIGLLSVDSEGVVLGTTEQGEHLEGSCDVTQWNNFRARIDYVNHSVEFLVNGASLGAVGLDPLVVDFYEADLSLVVNFQQSDHAVFYDNYRVSAHAQPVRMVPRMVSGGLEVSFNAPLAVNGSLETAPDLLGPWTKLQDVANGVTSVFIEAANLPSSRAFFRLVEAP